MFISTHDICRKLNCRNCHVMADISNTPDSVMLTYYNKKHVVTLYELGKMDSAYIHQYLFRSAHKGFFKGFSPLANLTDCEFRQLMYYFHHFSDKQYDNH